MCMRVSLSVQNIRQKINILIMSDQNLGGLRYSFQYMADLWGIHGVLAQSKSINFGKITDSGGKNLQTKDKLISIVHYRQSLLREVNLST